ncbi:MAG: peptidoglycan-binding protein [Alphaproteobacteria bacterium]|nr:peptidoglycan-binding protein [Alphaproteobacteria bacterium]
MNNGVFSSLTHAVGRLGKNAPEDVRRVETALDRAGYFDASVTDGPTGFFGSRLEKSIKDWQTDQGLKVDGLLKSGGPTEHSLFSPDAVLSEKSKTMRKLADLRTVNAEDGKRRWQDQMHSHPATAVRKTPPTDWGLLGRSAQQKVAQTGLDMMTGITAGVGKPLGRGVDWNKHKQYQAKVDALVPKSQANRPEARFGAGLGNALSLAGQLGAGGIGAMGMGAGEKVRKVHAQGGGADEQFKAGAYELGLGAVTGKLAGALGTGARAGRNVRAGKANLLEQSTWGLADNAFTLGENAASYGMKRGLDVLAGRKEEKIPQKREERLIRRIREYLHPK